MHTKNKVGQDRRKICLFCKKTKNNAKADYERIRVFTAMRRETCHMLTCGERSACARQLHRKVSRRQLVI